MSSPVPCKICGALPDVIGTPVEDCDVFSYFGRCSNVTIWNSNNGSPAIQEADNPLVDAELDRDHCWHERRDAASLCCDCEGLRDFLHATAATPVTPSDAARKAAEEISSTFGLRFQEDSLQRIAWIISQHLPVPVEEGDETK